MWVGEQLGFDGEHGAEKEFGPRWRWHLARTLYCRDPLFFAVVLEAQESLKYYGGIPFALKEAWEHFEKQGVATEGYAAGVAVRSPKSHRW